MPENIIDSIKKETFRAERELMRVHDQHVVTQYRAIAGTFEVFWREIGVRTNKALWRLEGPYKGTSTCKTVDYNLAWDLIGGIGQNLLLEQRDWKNEQTGGIRKHCPFFRVNQGCVLDNLKSPRCLDHVDSEHGEEIQTKFGLKVLDMRTPLAKVQLGGMNPEEGDWMVKPEVNDQFVIDTIEEWKERIDYVRTFPILHPEEAAAINYEEILSLDPISQPQTEKSYVRKRRTLPVINS